MLEGKILLLFFFACFSVTTPTKLLAQGAWSFFNTISAPALDSLQQQIYDSASVKPFVQNLTIKSYNDPENLLSAHSISLASGFTSSYTSTRTRIDVIDDSSFVWRGAIDTTGDVVISVTKGAIWGYITALTDTLEFLSLSDTLCIMYRVDVTQVPDSCVADTSTSSMNGNPPNQSVGNKPPEHNIKHNGKKKGEQILTHCDGSPIKVLFLYTERTLADLGSIPNIKAKVNGWVSDARQIAINSQSNENYGIAGIAATSLVEDSDAEVTRNTLHDDATTQTLRNSTNADVVVMMAHAPFWGSLYGIAYIGVINEDAYAVVRHDSPGNRYTFAHELGHIFGARHDNDPLNFPFRYGHGYSLPNGGSRTVMARAGTVGRIPYWSNPDITYNNEPLGTELGNDVARVHREVEHDIASFRDPMSITSISGPTTLEVNEQGIWSPEVCVGSSTGTTTYQWKYRVKGDLSWSSGGTSGTYSRSMGSNDCIILVQCKVCIGSDCDVALTAVDCENCTCSPAAYNDKNKNDGSRTTTSDESNSQDKGLQLICHGANPVSGKLQFQFTLPHSSPIKIQFYDSFGRLVSRLSDKLYELGTHNLSVDVSTWAPSVYICTLETNYKVATEYFTIIR